MNWNIRQRLDSETHRAPTIACLFALLAIGLAVSFSGGVAAAEPVNETVTVDNDTASIYVEATFADGIDDANATATATISDPSGTEFASGTISGNASETIVEEYNVTETDPTGNYSVVVTANDGVVASAEAGTFDVIGGGGGGSGSSDDADGWGSIAGYPAWIVALLAVVAALFAYQKGWLEELTN